jgi:hypothetical protein
MVWIAVACHSLTAATNHNRTWTPWAAGRFTWTPAQGRERAGKKLCVLTHGGRECHTMPTGEACDQSSAWLVMSDHGGRWWTGCAWPVSEYLLFTCSISVRCCRMVQLTASSLACGTSVHVWNVRIFLIASGFQEWTGFPLFGTDSECLLNGKGVVLSLLLHVHPRDHSWKGLLTSFVIAKEEVMSYCKLIDNLVHYCEKSNK